MVKEISMLHDVWVLTRENNRATIESWQEESGRLNVHWAYFDLPVWLRWWKKGGRGVRLYYYLWQIGAYFVAKSLMRKVQFDIVHHVTFAVYWRPSFLAFLKLPFVWGPLGGGDSTPRSFLAGLSSRGKAYELARSVALRVSELDPFFRLCAARARISLAATPRTAERLREFSSNVILLSQVALTDEELEVLTSIPFRTTSPFRFVSIGNLLHLKGFHLGLMAYASVHQELDQTEFWIIGDGPEMHLLKKLAIEIGIARKVSFLGRLPRSVLWERLNECNVLVHPSLHDSGAWVVAEAMAAGKPAICLDIGGPALQVTGETGIKIRASDPEQVINEIARGMVTLFCDTELRRRLGLAARERIREEFGWSKRRTQMTHIYEQVVTKNAGTSRT